MTILQKPDDLSLLGNLKKLILQLSSTSSVKLESSGRILLESTYDAGPDGKASIDFKEIITQELSFILKTDNFYEQVNIVKTFTCTVDGTIFSFAVIRTGISELADTPTNWLTQNFLTWQPQYKPVTYYSPEFITCYAVVNSTLKLKAYYSDGTNSTISLGSLVAGKAYTANLQYAVVAGLLGQKYPSYFDVWTEDNSGNRLSYIQRYYFSEVKSEQEQWFLFENSLGGIDTLRAYGDTDFQADHAHKIARSAESLSEYQIDTVKNYSKNTGYLDEYERKWLLDFFPSRQKFVHFRGAFRPIVVTESDVKYAASDLPSDYTFKYRFASETNGLLNLVRNESTIPAEIVIPNLDAPDFYLPPRLAEFPRTLNGGAIIPAFDPYTNQAQTTTIGAIIDAAAQTAVKNIPGAGEDATMVQVLDENSNIPATNKNVYSALRTLKEISESLKRNVVGKYLRRDVDDTADGLITFLKGIVSKSIVLLDKGFKTGPFGVNESGDSELNKIHARDLANLDKGFQTGEVVSELTGERKYKVDENGQAVLENITLNSGIKSPVFFPGFLGEGLRLFKNESGNWEMELDDLTVRKNMDVFQLTINKIKHVGGAFLFSPAAVEIERVEELADVYRCYVKNKDNNLFEQYDQGICQNFTKNKIKRYWRLVTAVAPDFSFVELSKTDCEAGSALPEAGDELIQLGNRSNLNRQNAILISSYGNDGAYQQFLSGIDSYSLANKIFVQIGKETFFKAHRFEIVSGNESIRVPADKGEWNPGIYNYYDRVSHNGSLWLCVAQPFTGVEPTDANSAMWQKQVSKGADGAKGADGIAGKDGVGIKTTTITYGLSASDITQPTTWTSSVPTLVKGQYLWTKTVWTYTDNSTETGYTKTYIAKDGNNGTDGIAGKDGVGIVSTTIEYAVSPSGTVKPTAGYTATVPYVVEGQYLWTRTTWKYTDNTSEQGFSVARMGTDGAKGDKGDVGEMLTGAKMIYKDPTFKGGNNWANVYNNYSNGTVELARVAREVDNPTDSGFQLKWTYKGGGSSPGLGGFYFRTPVSANKVLITKIIAKIPINYMIDWASNAIGNGGWAMWLGSQYGTGKYETYICKVICGATGTFADTNYFYIVGVDAPMSWDIAYATVFDMSVYDDTYDRKITEYDAKFLKTDRDITLWASETEKARDNISGLTTRTTANEAQLKVQGEEIASKVSQTDYNNNNVAVQQKFSSIEQSAGEIALSVSNMQIGGRNTFKDKLTDISVLPITGEAPMIDRNNVECPYGFYFVGNRTPQNNARINNVITENGWWTISWDMRGIQSTPISVAVAICYRGNKTFITTGDNTWKRFSHTVYVDNYNEVYNFIDFTNFSWAYFLIRNIKVEKGTKATDFTEAPELIDAAISSVRSELSIKIDSNTSTITSQAHTINSLTGRIESAEQKITPNSIISTVRSSNDYKGDLNGLQSQITQTANAISMKVWNSDIVDSIWNDKYIRDTRNTNEQPSWYFANYPYRDAKEFKSNTVIGLPVFGTGFCVLLTNVPWGNISGGSVKQTAICDEYIYKRYGDMGGWGAWQMVADRKNLLATGIDIEAQKITLTANNTIIQNNYGQQIALFNADGTKISASVIQLEGVITNGSNFKVNLDGTIEATNGIFKGKVEATSGEFRNVTIYESAKFFANRSMVFKKLSQSDAVLVESYNKKYDLRNDMFLYIGHGEQINLPVSENYIGKELIVFSDDFPITRTQGDGPSFIYCANPIVGETIYNDMYTTIPTRKITFSSGMIGLICIKQGTEIRWSTIYNTSHVFERTQF